MERKLAAYRAKKEREDMFNKGKEKLAKLLTLPKTLTSKNSLVPIDGEEAAEEEKLLSNDDELEVLSDASEIDNLNCCSCSYTKMIYYTLWFVLWTTVYVICIKLQFGTVYFLASALIGIYLNTRTSPKRANEISAYSVFNKNCESIDGTLTAEQFEREIRYGRTILHV